MEANWLNQFMRLNTRFWNVHVCDCAYVCACVCEDCALVFDFFHCDFLTPLFYTFLTDDTE